MIERPCAIFHYSRPRFGWRGLPFLCNSRGFPVMLMSMETRKDRRMSIAAAALGLETLGSARSQLVLPVRPFGPVGTIDEPGSW
jgi:hypothetical protein